MRPLLTKQAHQLLQGLVQAGDVVIDATAGNGHDTLFLARQVGTTGRVFAFDIQREAITATTRRLQMATLLDRVTLCCNGHEDMAVHVPSELHGRIKAIVFNLGYLPGGNKLHTTQVATTLRALQQGLALLQAGGVLSVIAYTGHPGGRDEAVAIQQWAVQLNTAVHEVTLPQGGDNDAPHWHVFMKHVVTPATAHSEH